MNDEIIRNTIAKMREAGLSDSIISSTLTDLGLTPAQIQSYIAPRGGTSPAHSRDSFSTPPAPTAIPPGRFSPNSSSASDIDHEVIASRTSEKVMQRLDEREAMEGEEADLKDNITHLAMEQHGEQLQATHQAVMDLHEKFDSTALDTISNRVSALNSKVESMSKELTETKALAGALQSLMQKILEANQQLLFEMKNKKA